MDLKTYNRDAPPLFFQSSKEPMNAEDMASIMARASCDECGVLFETLSDLQNHVRSWCYGGSDRKEEAEMVMLPGDRQIMYKKYLTFLKKLFTFHKSELHRSIVRAVKEELDKSFDMTTAIRNVLRKRKMEITDFVDTGEESS